MQGSIVLDPPTAGIINIKLTAAVTAAGAPGRYTDALRIILAGKTFRGGVIFVDANPFPRG